jgi:hypothetical protein
MVKFARKGAAIYVLIMLYFVFYSQSRCSDVERPAASQKQLSTVDAVTTEKLPSDWNIKAEPPDEYRRKLQMSNAALVTLPVGVPQALKGIKRLKARDSIAAVDPTLFTVTALAQAAHSQGNYEIRKTKMGARGVPIYASSRGGGYSSSSRSSSGYRSGHK